MDKIVFKQKPVCNRGLSGLLMAAMLAIVLTNCSRAMNQGHDQNGSSTDHKIITAGEVLAAQKAWGDGIVHIGQVYLDQGDYKAAATEHINKFYNYRESTVLFKPTMASVKQFRTDSTGALSYFIGGNADYPEDKGFALKSWQSVRWESTGVQLFGVVAVAMGNYYFQPAKGGSEIKVEYSFAYTRNRHGDLKIILHDSHFPFKSAAIIESGAVPPSNDQITE